MFIERPFYAKAKARDAKKDFTAPGQHSLPRFSHVIRKKLARFEVKPNKFCILQTQLFCRQVNVQHKDQIHTLKKGRDDRSVFAL